MMLVGLILAVLMPADSRIGNLRLTPIGTVMAAVSYRRSTIAAIDPVVKKESAVRVL